MYTDSVSLDHQWFDHERGRWLWNLNKVKDMGYTDNVVEFMAQDLRNLPKEVRCVSPSSFILVVMASPGTPPDD
jgi:hypothetical protein